jgi:hypothetical protein
MWTSLNDVYAIILNRMQSLTLCRAGPPDRMTVWLGGQKISGTGVSPVDDARAFFCSRYRIWLEVQEWPG